MLIRELYKVLKVEIGEFLGYYKEFYNNRPVTSQYSPATTILNENPAFFSGIKS